MGLFSKVKENVQDVTTMARGSVESLQTKHDLAQAYEQLGRRSFDLLERGKLEAPELNLDVEAIQKLKESSAGSDEPASSTEHAEQHSNTN